MSHRFGLRALALACSLPVLISCNRDEPFVVHCDPTVVLDPISVAPEHLVDTGLFTRSVSHLATRTRA